MRFGVGEGINQLFPNFLGKLLLVSKENRTFASSKETLIT